MCMSLHQGASGAPYIRAMRRVRGWAVTFCLVVGLAGSDPARSACTAAEGAELSASNLQADDRFGYSVALDAELAVIGARFDDNLGGQKAGTARIFRYEAGVWVEEATLFGDGTANVDGELGWSVAVSGATVAVGNPQCRSLSCSETGKAFVYHFNGASWVQQAELHAADAQARDYFGSSISVDGDWLITGADLEDAGGFQAGAAYVFHRTSGVWAQAAKLLASDAAEQSQFGEAVALDPVTAVIGASYDDEKGLNCGAAYVFERTGTVWSEVRKLTASDALAESEQAFGRSVAVDSDRVVVGAPQAGGFRGAVYVFERNQGGPGNWGEVVKLTAPSPVAGDNFGTAVGLDGDTLIVGAVGDAQGGAWSGAAWVFRFDGASWSVAAKLVASDAAPFDYFGQVALSGGRALIGAPGNSVDLGSGITPGAVYGYGGQGDCNANGTLDLCDVTTGGSADENGDGTPDECDAPGRIPATLSVERLPSGALRLSWAASECAGASDYAVYQGSLGAWESHVPIVCTDGGLALEETITPQAASSYYLVVPLAPAAEGSYGLASGGAERPPSASPCRPVQQLDCP